ncbi:Phosphoglycerate mutase-like protein 2 [Hondaea fermentalgiana]|uniref:Phosphoglycerate mutase-like protein 2 n=1 Tax=Hondaea fermentalgiana TaxID=2315210 RepID=A0A2R5G1N5_9STRA|nr:Phosphoglycerate mutase-like protein 2 [Hondaea fermentalgiana]|eukprot:GBG24902.1 Phosphoglycerate mutase-like protein 2 [Hondaea fermentalgiana]
MTQPASGNVAALQLMAVAVCAGALLARARARALETTALNNVASAYWTIVERREKESKQDTKDESFPAHIVPDPCLEPDNENLAKLGLKPNHCWTDVDIKKHPERKRKLVLLVRHAEAIHNVAEKAVGKKVWNETEGLKEKYLDAPLNDTGRAQAAALAEAVKDAIQNKGLHIDAIVLSPLARALETAHIGLASVWENVPKVAVEHCRERFGICLSEKRRQASVMAADYPGVDFSRMLVSDHDSWHRDDYRETPADIERRVHTFFDWLINETPWDHVAVVTHSDYIAHALQALGAPWHWPANGELVPVVVEANISN